MENIKANIQLLPGDLELIERKKSQEKLSSHYNQELKQLGDEKITRSYQSETIKKTKTSVKQVIWHMGDMDLIYEGDYDKVVSLLDEAIVRADSLIKPLMTKRRMSVEHMERLDKELMDRIKTREMDMERLKNERIQMGKKRQQRRRH